MSEREERSVDATVSGYLADEFRFVSRRSMMARLTRIVFGVAGVVMGSTVLPFSVPEAEAAGSSWKHCGLHGYLCQGGCTGGTLGSGAIRAWQVCCEDPSCSKWFCCVYSDQCGKRGPSWGTSCGGTTPEGPAWCGDRSGSYEYICTVVTCGGGAGAKKREDCSCSGIPC